MRKILKGQLKFDRILNCHRNVDKFQESESKIDCDKRILNNNR